MRAHVRLRIDEEREVELGHGDLIGRLASAALCLDDARISEAHAMVSLRGDELMLLSLRRRFKIGGEPLAEATLRTEQVIELAPGLEVTVEDVVLPETILGVACDGQTAQPLHGVTSLFGGAEPKVLAGYQSGAEAHVWATDDRWRMRVGDDEAHPISAGQTVELSGVHFAFVEMPLGHAGVDMTRAGAAVPDPLEIIARFETVHIHRRGGQHLVSLSGVAARILSELVSFDGPASWHVIAREIWRDEDDDRMALRRKWDVNLSRLRRKLREAGVRGDLVRADGLGNFELLLYEGDRTQDKT